MAPTNARLTGAATSTYSRPAAHVAPLFALLFALTLAPPRATRAQPQHQAAARPSGAGQEVKLTVTVSDVKGRYVSGLTEENFAVTERGAPRRITSFGEGGGVLSALFVIDVSGSMDQKKIAVAQRIAAWFVLASDPRSEYAIMEFGGRGRGLADWTSARAEIEEGLGKVGQGSEGKPPLGGNTALYAACDAALDKLATARHPRRVMLLITDGQDNASRITFKELTRRVRASDALIYAFGLIERGNPGSLDAAGQAELDELADDSGGRAYFVTTLAEAREVAERTAIELQHQYVLGFEASDPALSKEEWRKVKISVRAAAAKDVTHLVARSREGYFARPKS